MAEARGIASLDALSAMTEDEIIGLIFTPGLSTAPVVSEVSGRGVGMDVVRSTIERLGGRVEVVSRAGEGTRVLLRVPFTVMMSRVLTIEAGGQMFGVPMELVIETIRLPRERIVQVGAAAAFVLKERTVPLFNLADAVGFRDESREGRQANVVITEIAGQLAALEVDRFGEHLDVMLKPMDGLLAGLRGIAGTTLLGDGRVLIVLDMLDLLQ
jgi:two-component system chemotaxis sensor kinase CheA